MPTTWKKLRKALKTAGVHVDSRGSEAKLSRENPDGTVDLYCLQHECCRSASSVVWDPHLAAIRRKFGLTHDDV